MASQLCGVCTPLAVTIKVFRVFQVLPPVQGVGECVGVGVGDLLPLGDVPDGPHPAHPVPVDGVLGVWTAACIHHGCKGEEASDVSADFKCIHVKHIMSPRQR